MKLYVWSDPYHVAYGSSLLIAVADSVEEARALAASKCIRYSFGEYEQGRDGMESTVAKLGTPTRVVDLPCAEWHEWME